MLGRVQNGVVVFDGSQTFPEGTEVAVTEHPARHPRPYLSITTKRMHFESSVLSGEIAESKM